MRALPIALVALIVSLPNLGQANVPSGAASEQVRASSDRLVWQWRRPDAWEYVATGAVGAGAIALEFFTEQSLEPEWVRPVWFDTSVRNSLRASSSDTREVTSLVSDYLGLGTQVWSYLDTTLVPLATDGGNWDVAWQMTFINLQATALTVLGTRGIDRLAVRQRPDVEPCEADPEYHEMCFRGPNSSFPSGHTSGAFVGAGLVCAHHLYLPLYGNPYADGAACALAAGAAVATGVLRVVADRHYVTDVFAGAAVGAAAGFVVPVFAHYWFVESVDPTALFRGFTWLPIVGAESFELAFAAYL